MVADLVRQVGGDRVSVEQLMGPGVDPHLYKPSTADAARLARARVVFYSGLRLEGRMEKILEHLGRSGRVVRAVTDAIPKERLLAPPDFAGHYDPHVWFDVELWGLGVPVVVEALAEADPAGRDYYAERGAKVSARLAELHQWCLDLAAGIPEHRRVLVTSHDAYSYFGRAYGFRVVGLQGVSTVSEAALSDMTGLVDLLKQQGIPAIFVETSVNPAALQRVAEDAGVRIGGEIFSDALGGAGEMRQGFDTGTYDGMVRYNLTMLVEALR